MKLPRKLRHVDVSKVHQEVTKLERALRDASTRVRNSHVVSLDSQRFVSCDANILNRSANQSRRGNYRYLFQNQCYAGVYEHTPSGDYRKVA